MSQQKVYSTKDNDRIDAICYTHYGTVEGTVEKVLNANRALAKQPGVLPNGVQIILPEIASNEVEELVRLWE